MKDKSQLIQETDNIYKAKMLEVLKEFLSICEVNKLNYFVIGGTLIGAVRHQGFIPWDDDIDIGMPRRDYDRFLKCMEEYKSDYFSLALALPDNKYYLPFAKFYDKTSCLIEFRHILCPIGVHLDIFPLDGINGSEDIRNNKFDNFYLLRQRFWQMSVRKKDKVKEIIKSILTIKIRHAISVCKDIIHRKAIRQSLIEMMNSKMTIDGYEGCAYIANYGGAWGYREISEAIWFSDYELCKFEDINVRIPIGFDLYLKRMYGDYMELPPIEKRKSHHSRAYLDLTTGRCPKHIGLIIR